MEASLSEKLQLAAKVDTNGQDACGHRFAVTIGTMPQLRILFLGYCAIVVLLYWITPARWRSIFLALSSSVFLIYLDASSFAVLCAFTVLIYFYGRQAEAKAFYFVCIGLVLLLFCGIRVLQLLNRSGYAVPFLILVGFGFYALKLIHYAVESRAKTFKPHRFLDFYNYMLFFPTITIGPIHLFDEFTKSERRIRWNDQDFASGLERILYGYTKVIVLANWLVALKFDAYASQLEPGAVFVLAHSMVYGFYLYFSFAGYSDIAIGLSRLLGYQVNENFNWPFLRRNIGEFWQSWHMSLSFWCRKYVFLPIYATWRTLSVALIGTMLAIALWHEFSIRFFLWGFYHGFGLLIWRVYQRFTETKLPKLESSVWRGLGTGLSIALTFLFVMIGFTIPRSESLADILKNFQLLLSL